MAGTLNDPTGNPLDEEEQEQRGLPRRGRAKREDEKK